MGEIGPPLGFFVSLIKEFRLHSGSTRTIVSFTRGTSGQVSVREEREGNHAIEVGTEARRMPTSSVLGRAALEELSKHNVCGGESPSVEKREKEKQTTDNKTNLP